MHIFDPPTNTFYYDKTFTEPETVTVTGLPTNGADLTVGLSMLHNDQWWSVKYYNLKSAQLVDNAHLISHTDKQSLTGSTETFIWNDVGAQQYSLRVVKPGSDYWGDIILERTFDGTTTSATLHNLPINNGEVHVRLRTKHDGWATREYIFTGAGLLADAELTSHENNATFSSIEETLTWSKAADAEAYYLLVTNPVLDMDARFEEDYEPTITQQTLSDLPLNNAPIHITLRTKQHGFWANKTYRMRGHDELPNADIITPKAYEKLTSSSITVTWNDVDADAYHLRVTDLLTGNIIHDEGYTAETTTATVNNLPDNKIIRMAMMTKHGRWWSTNDNINVITAGYQPNTDNIIGVTGEVQPLIDTLSIAEGWTHCTGEGKACDVPVPAYVRYGSLGQYKYAYVNDTIDCNNSIFGGDPVHGVIKHCDYLLSDENDYDGDGVVDREDDFPTDLTRSKDVEPPSITAPDMIVKKAATGLTTIDFSNVTAIDKEDGSVIVTPDITGPFTEGTHTITWTATDRSGNTAITQQTITIESFSGTWHECRLQIGGVCHLPIPTYVRYGAQEHYYYKQVNDSIACNNTAFGGDPIFGVVKHCDYLFSDQNDYDGDGVDDNSDAFPADPTETRDTDGDGMGDNIDPFPTDANNGVDNPLWTFCAGESQECDLPSEGWVRYGAEQSYIYEFVEDSIACSNRHFGDPIFGVHKSCDYLLKTMTK